MVESIVAVAIGVLTVIFIGSLTTLILVCRHKYCGSLDLLWRQFSDSRPEEHLIGSDEATDLELDDVRLHPNIEKILTDEQWVDDATGLIPHCLAVLKKCHQLTESLVTMTMSSITKPQQVCEIISIAKRISPRVDDVVRSMYPPLDPRLLEARCIALILSVSHLAVVIKSACHIPVTYEWIDAALNDMEENIQVLREAGIALEFSTRPASVSTTVTHLQYDASQMNG